jgi:hypothetical protein
MLGSVPDPVIQANGRLIFENDLRSGGRLGFTTQWTSIRTGLADSMVTLGGTQGWLGVVRDVNFACRRHPAAQSDICEQQWVTGFHNELSLCVKCCRMVDSVPRWRLSLSRPIQSDHLSIAECDDTAFGAGTLVSTFLESRSWLENYYYYYETIETHARAFLTLNILAIGRVYSYGNHSAKKASLFAF